MITNGRRILKVLQFGAKTADECAPFGDDSCPVANLTAVYASTSNIAEPVIIGYLNLQQLAEIGEKRLYSIKTDGTLGFYCWLKNDGTMQLGGTAHNLVRYTPLASAINAKDALINTELGKIAAAIGSLGGVYTPGTVSTNITASKINEIKTL